MRQRKRVIKGRFTKMTQKHIFALTSSGHADSWFNLTGFQISISEMSASLPQHKGRKILFYGAHGS